MARGWILGATLLALACNGGEPASPAAAEATPTPESEPTAQASDTAVELVAPGIISTGTNQTFPAEDPLTGDLWFSVYERGFNDQTIMWARRDDDGWATPEVAPFSGEWGDRAPRFAPDGSAMLITSNRPRPDSDEAGDMNIWRLARADSGWGEPELLESGVNSTAADIHRASPMPASGWPRRVRAASVAPICTGSVATEAPSTSAPRSTTSTASPICGSAPTRPG